MPPLDGTIPFAEMTNISILITCYLYFDMAWFFYKFFHVDTVILKRSCLLRLWQYYKPFPFHHHSKRCAFPFRLHRLLL